MPDRGPSISVVPGLDRPVLSSKDAVKLLPMSETFDFDRGLLLAVQAVQVEFSLSLFSTPQPLRFNIYPRLNLVLLIMVS